MKVKIFHSETLVRCGEYLQGSTHKIINGSPESISLPVEYSGNIPDKLSFLVGTSQGLLILTNSCLYKLLDGPIYGITRNGNEYYAIQRLGHSARVIRFLIEYQNNGVPPRVYSLQTVLYGLSNGVHQIDFVGEILFITDTYHNCLSLFRKDGTLVDRIYPSGKLTRDDIFTPLYRHYNSIYWDGAQILLMAHNNSLKTGRGSLIQFVDANNPSIILDEWRDIGLCAHNILRRNDATFWCDSLNSTVYRDHEPVTVVDNHLTRGLAIDDQFMIVGGSAILFGNKRLNADGRINILDISDFSKVGEMIIKGVGAVSEIRLLNLDYGLSNTNLPSRLVDVANQST
jgi:hypothetical protein